MDIILKPEINLAFDIYGENMKVRAMFLAVMVMTPLFAMAQSKMYVAVDAGSANYSGVTVALGTYPNPGTFSAAFGYRVIDRLALEVGGTAFGNSSLIASNVTGTVQASSWGIRAVGDLPLGAGFSLIGNAGIGFNSQQITASSSTTTVTVSGSSTSPVFGVGAQYNFNHRFALRAQYENYGSFGQFGTTGGNMTASTFTLGGMVNF